MFSRVDPVPVVAPAMVVLNHALADGMGLDRANLDDGAFAKISAGNLVPDGAEPLAQAYAGHQFGHFTMLGDGRAILLGEHICPDGQRLDVQLKGAGRTPYSRNGDGRAALGPMLREYLISEAMAGLGIPTTRSLAVVATGENVFRDAPLPGAVLVRVAASHIRVGTFEYIAGLGDVDMLRGMVDYTLRRHDPDMVGAENPALGLLRAVMARQAALVAAWMRVGFVHGVMNTDNVAISGETIDYGPCAFMDVYDPATVFSSIDTRGRYAFAQQPVIAQWNMARFAEALLPLIDDDMTRAIAMAEDEIAAFGAMVQAQIQAVMAAKIGLVGVRDEDAGLLADLLGWMRREQIDYTAFFRDLSVGGVMLEGRLAQSPALRDWHDRWLGRLGRNDVAPDAARAMMRQQNPAVIPRNHLVEAALAAAVAGDMAPFHDLLAVVQRPYDDGAGEKFCTVPPGQGRYQTFCGT